MTPEELEEYYGDPFTPEKWAINIKRLNTVLMEEDGWFLYIHESSTGKDKLITCLAHIRCMWLGSVGSFYTYRPYICPMENCGRPIPDKLLKTMLLMK